MKEYLPLFCCKSLLRIKPGTKEPGFVKSGVVSSGETTSILLDLLAAEGGCYFVFCLFGFYTDSRYADSDDGLKSPGERSTSRRVGAGRDHRDIGMEHGYENCGGNYVIWLFVLH